MKDVRVIVRVQDQAGAPVSGAFVSLESAEAVLPEMALRTNAAGAVEVSLPAGRMRARADAGGRNCQAESDLAQQSEDGPAEIVLVLPPEP